jgi:hypothetical protein
MNAQAKAPRTTKLSNTPLVHETSELHASRLGRYTEIAERCHLAEVTLDDYSYVMRDVQIWAASIGKFANIASHVRINAPNHPTWRASLHHFTYRAGDYWPEEENEPGFFDWRRENHVTIGHDVWIGHGATILPGVSIGNGAAIGAGAVVAKDVAPYTIVGGVPAKVLKNRFSPEIGARLDALAWWDWDHETLRKALPDFRALSIEDFLNTYEGRNG